VLCSLALLIRLIVVWRYVHTIAWPDFWTFGFEPSHIAAALVRGFGFSSPFTDHSGPTAWIPPVYPWIISLAYRLFGIYSAKAVGFMLALNLTCATLTTAAIYRIGLRCFSAEVAFGGALLWTVSPDAVAMSVRIWDISAATLLMTLMVLSYLRAIESKQRWSDWIAFGILAGVSALTTTTLLAMLPFVLVVLFFFPRGAFRKPSIVVLAITVLLMLPWVVRNFDRFGRLIPIRGNFGAELWAGNHPGVRGPADESVHPLKNKSELIDYLRMGESQYVASRQKMAIQFIRQNPGRFVQLTGERILSFWTSPLVMDSAWPAICAMLAWAATVLLLWRRETWLIATPFAATMIFFPFSYYISHAESYFRSPIEPLISLLAVYAFFRCIEWISSRGKAPSGESSMTMR
jgi:4-amino-4-deoxy-L-arabinose transferase-like glycosyltransferase